MNPRTRLAVVVPLLSVLALTSCTSSGPAGGSTGSADGGGKSAPLKVMASFYPLQYVTEQVGGTLVTVESLTPPGTEPHDLELSPASVAALKNAAAVVYLSGFQPAVDDAVKQASPAHVVDVAGVVDLKTGHAEQEHTGTAGEAIEGVDPHFWLDPERLAKAAGSVAGELGEADPANAATYKANADSLAGKLATLNKDFASGLANCKIRTIVVSHEAYGYLTEKYNLKQAGISALDPNTEPSPARLAEIGKVVKDEGVTTIFTETLVNPKVAETLAADLGIKTAVLDPVEGLVDAGSDYEKVMRKNLGSLRTALDCS